MAKKKRHIHLRRGAEIEGLRESGHLAAEVLRLTSELVKPGLSTGEIDEAAADLIAGVRFSVIVGFPAISAFP